MTESLFAGLSCAECGRTYPAQLSGICECGGLLLSAYVGFAERPSEGDMWSWAALLPPCEPISLGEGETPLIPFGPAWIKDEGRLPTGTFKARGAALGVSMAKQLGADAVVLPSAGNAGVAWAAYSAKANLPCRVFVPQDTEDSLIDKMRLYGADVSVVGETIDFAGIEAFRYASENGSHLASTFREPWRIEGKKTAYFEATRQLEWKMPDAVVFPVGGGVGLLAARVAAGQLRTLGWASGTTRLYAVQAEGCAPIVSAFESELDSPDPWPNPKTAAAGLKIPSPLAGGAVIKAINETGGGVASVSDDAMRRAQEIVAKKTGLVLVLEAAAAVAGYQLLNQAGAFLEGARVVIYGTGSGF